MESIKLDAFNTQLQGCRILCQGPFHKYPPIMEFIQTLREPFKKKILLTKTAFSLSKYVPLQYDAMFQIKDSADWTMVLTYATYAPKPLLLVSEDIPIPDGLWAKLSKAMTFVNMTSAPVISLRPYDAIFFAPMEDATFTEYVYKILQSVYRASYSAKEHKEVVQELRVAGAGLAWGKEESQLYWYDPVAQNAGDQLTSAQLADLFSCLAGQFQRS